MPLDGVAFPIGNCGFGIWLNCDAVLRYFCATMCGIAVFVAPLRPPLVFPAQAEYSYFSADFRLKIFLHYS